MSVDRIDIAEQHLDRIHSFFPRVDAKVGAVAGWLSIELAAVALNVKLPDLRTWFVGVPFALFVGAEGMSAYKLWSCLFPDTRGGLASLIYFAEIAKRNEANFIRDYRAMTEDELLNDLAGQIWRNAEIICDKYSAVQSAIRWATGSLLLLIATILATSVLHDVLPRLPGASG